ncbi:MAG: pyridoxal phosphate-dependent aminotransferase [Kosmotoga sp.]|nr:MAG: pyridoxal phosphate-dependent aminotransferase [Kosmotoga sp.]
MAGISNRAKYMPSSPIRKLVPYAEKAKEKGIEIFHLNIGQPDIETPDVFMDYINKHGPRVVPYSHSAGLIELRKSFCDYYKRRGIELNSEEIIITSGGSEAIIFALASVADPEDEVIVIEPFYANYRGFANLLNIKTVPITSHVENGYRLPPAEDFEKVLSSKTRAILFSNPSNPTGTVYTQEEMNQLIALSKKYDLFLISDEVYREFTFDNTKTYPLLSLYPGNRSITVDSVSKRFSACGARIGLIASKNKEVMNSAMKFAQARLSPPAISQLGTIGLLTLDDSYLEKIKNEYEKRRNVVYEELSKIDGVVMHKPQGAFYISVALPVDDAESFVKWMLTDFSLNGKTTMVAPLQGFYSTPGKGKNEVRIAYVLSIEKLRLACNILSEGIRAYNKIKV